MSDIGRWLEERSLGKYADLFLENEIDFDVLGQITLEELRDLGIPLGARKRILNAIAQRHTDDPCTTGSARAHAIGSLDSAERRQLTFMFCDLVDSVGLGERMELEDYRDLLGRFRTAAVGAVEAHGGFVARHEGDGLLVYFGYPMAHEDDAERAARAGLEIVDAVQGLLGPDGCRLEVRVGVATGPAVVGDVLQAGGTHEFGALGRTPNLAARLQGQASPNSVLVAAGTAELIRGRFQLESLAARELKGIKGPVSSYRVIRERRTPTRFEARASARLSEFVGREEELELFERRWRQALSGQGQALVLVGEPGIGKSRLSGRFLQLKEPQLARTVSMQCSPDLSESALHPAVAYLNFVVGNTDRSGNERLGELAAWTAEHVGEEPELVALLADLLSLPLPEGSDPGAATGLDAGQRRERTLGALIRHVETLAGDAPLALLIEDLHWADPSTRELLERIVQRIETLSVLAIATTRPGFQAPWLDAPHVRVLHMARLTGAQSEILAQSAAPALDEYPRAILAEIVARAGGNPLYVEEIARSAAQRPLDAADQPPVPFSLQDSLMARLDGLEFGKAVAQFASVIGREFDDALLRSIWDGDPQTLDRGLQTLTREGLVYQHGEGEGRSYQFKHALVQDTAYESLLRERRQLLHRRVANSLRTLRPELADAQPERLAHHFFAANELSRAIEMWDVASARAVQRASHQEVVEHCETALTLIARGDSVAGAPDRRIVFLMRLANSQRVLDRLEQAAQTLDRAESLLAPTNEATEERARIHHIRGNISFTMGRTDECEIQHERALRLARALGNHELELAALSGLGDAAYAKGRMISAEALFNRMLMGCEEYGLPAPSAANLSMRADTRTYCGRLGEAIADAKQGLERARDANDVRARVLNYGSGAMALYESARFSEAVRWASSSADAAKVLGSPNLESNILSFEARALVEAGDYPSALQRAHAAFEQAGRGSPAFAGAMAAGAAALAERSPARGAEWLRRGELILGQDCVSHNVLWFCADAVEVSLRDAAFDECERFALMLEQYTREEPLPWSELLIARGRALARFGKGERSSQLEQRLHAIEERAKAGGFERLRASVREALIGFNDAL